MAEKYRAYETESILQNANLSETPTTSNSLLRISESSPKELMAPNPQQNHADDHLTPHDRHLLSLDQQPQQQQQQQQHHLRNDPWMLFKEVTAISPNLPLSPDKCPLFCCFYAEFDIRVGPKVCFQSPRGFMDLDISLSTEAFQDVLADTFGDLQQIRDNDIHHSYETGLPQSTSTAASTSSTVLCDTVDHSEPTNGPSSTTSDSGCPSYSAVGISIFDSTSEFIIAGNELAGTIINLSTDFLHILTRPTVISNERYERNSLLFSVGFVLRRSEDPRTFRPLLFKLASTLQRMEMESNFLTEPTSRIQIQPMLDSLLFSLNGSNKSECYLRLNDANLLSLKRFLPPKPPSPPVSDHDVPILLRKDWQLHLYDWDLAINWVIMHIDGVANAKQISLRSEVDMEMVRACLRVLKHHDVIDLVDMFFFSNHYEFTERAAALLAGKEPELLQQQVEYVLKSTHSNADTTRQNSELTSGNFDSLRVVSTVSTIGNDESFPEMLARSPISSYAPQPPEGLSTIHNMHSPPSVDNTKYDKMFRLAIAELHCACSRTISLSDLWLSLVSSDSVSKSTSSWPIIGRRRKGKSNKFKEFEQGWTRNEDQKSQLFVDRNVVIDWNVVFDSIDHRRWATFAVVHGLLRRVHIYPLVISVNRRQVFNFEHLEVRDNTTDETILAYKIAEMMDGTHSDDEIVAEFNLPLEKLFQHVKSIGVDTVVSVYSIDQYSR